MYVYHITTCQFVIDLKGNNGAKRLIITNDFLGKKMVKTNYYYLLVNYYFRRIGPLGEADFFVKLNQSLPTKP
jgi:hypothetical protein